MFAKSVKSVLSAVIKRKFHPTASQYWKFLLELFPINGGKDGFCGFCGFVFNLFYLILLFKTVSKILLFIYIPEFLKTGLVKIRAHFTTWQLKAIKSVQRPIKKPISDAEQ